MCENIICSQAINWGHINGALSQCYPSTANEYLLNGDKTFAVKSLHINFFDSSPTRSKEPTCWFSARKHKLSLASRVCCGHVSSLNFYGRTHIRQ